MGCGATSGGGGSLSGGSAARSTALPVGGGPSLVVSVRPTREEGPTVSTSASEMRPRRTGPVRCSFARRANATGGKAGPATAELGGGDDETAEAGSPAPASAPKGSGTKPPSSNVVYPIIHAADSGLIPPGSDTGGSSRLGPRSGAAAGAARRGTNRVVAAKRFGRRRAATRAPKPLGAPGSATAYRASRRRPGTSTTPRLAELSSCRAI